MRPAAALRGGGVMRLAAALRCGAVLRLAAALRGGDDLDLDQVVRVQQPGHHHERGRRPDRAEKLAVHPADRVGVVAAGHVHPGAHDVCAGRTPSSAERVQRDPERRTRLAAASPTPTTVPSTVAVQPARPTRPVGATTRE